MDSLGNIIPRNTDVQIDAFGGKVLCTTALYCILTLNLAVVCTSHDESDGLVFYLFFVCMYILFLLSHRNLHILCCVFGFVCRMLVRLRVQLLFKAADDSYEEEENESIC